VVVEKKTVHHPNSQAQLHALIDQYKAGSPTDPNLYWIHLKPKEIAMLYFAQYGVLFSNGFIKKELIFLGYKYRKISKTLATGNYKNRDTQFQIIFNLVLIMSLKSPILSIDCKKKELLGTLYREGKSYCQTPHQAYDHDYSHLGKGKIIPHGIFDLQKNIGFVSIGNSSETATFIVDNLRWWWDNYGINDYPDARNILILCDAGGGNSYRHHAFKKELQTFTKEIGVDIIVAHYPPYASKWNPIEHRLFCHVHQAMSGQMFNDYQFVKTLIEKTSTKQGLKVIVRIHLKEYQIGIKTNKNEIDEKRIQRHPTIPELNYRIAA
jgi:Rhodopirellula transposase DDE domain